MKKNENINIDKLFDKARNQKVEFSEAEIRGLVYENSPIINKSNFIKLKGVNKMTIWSGAIATAAIISALTLSFLSDLNNVETVNKKTIIAANNNISKNIEANNSDGKPEFRDSVIISKKIILIDNQNENSIESQSIDVSNNMKTIVLSEVELKDLGVKINHDDDFIEVIMNEDNPRKHKIHVNLYHQIKNINNLNEQEQVNYQNYPLPQMITDNKGSRVIKVFNNSIFVDGSSHSVDGLNFTKEIEMFADSILINNSWINHDGKLKLDKEAVILLDNKVLSNDSNLFNGLNLNINFDSIKTSVFSSINIDIDSLSDIIYNSIRIDSSIIELKNKLKMDTSLLKLRKQYKLNNDSIFRSFKFDKNSKINIPKFNIPKFNIDSQMKIIKNKVELFNDKLVNKLIPIEVPIKNVKDKNGKEINDFKFILWYEPTEKLMKYLPRELGNQLRSELKLLENNNENCANVPITGEDKYLGVWQGCNGALENLRVFPNPTNGPIAVDLNLKEVRNISISLHDISGRKIKTIQNSTNANVGSWTTKYNISDVKAGLYLLVVQSERGEQAVQRIVVE